LHDSYTKKFKHTSIMTQPLKSGMTIWGYFSPLSNASYPSGGFSTSPKDEGIGRVFSGNTRCFNKPFGKMLEENEKAPVGCGAFLSIWKFRSET